MWISCLAGMNTLIGYDLVPEPKIIEAALRACRRLNDLASAVRILEAVKVTAATQTKCMSENIPPNCVPDHSSP